MEVTQTIHIWPLVTVEPEEQIEFYKQIRFKCFCKHKWLVRFHSDPIYPQTSKSLSEETVLLLDRKNVQWSSAMVLPVMNHQL